MFYKPNHLLPHTNKCFAEGKNDAVTHTDRPWHCLVSYVDDLTVGGRRNSKGIFVDPMNLPSFGDQKPPKEPEDCFPQQCYDKYVRFWVGMPMCGN